LGFITITIPAGRVGSNLTDFVTYVDLSHMPDWFWSGVDSNGGDIRVKTAGGGSTLPTDLVWIDVSSKTGALFFRASLLAASDNVFEIHYDTGLNRLSVSDANGRNAVWQDYQCVTLLGVDPNDRTGNYTPAVNGDPSMFEVVSGPHSFTQDPHQGVAWDGTHWYLFGTNAIYKFDDSFSLVASNTDVIGDSGISGVNHCGDGCYHDGYLYTVVEVYPSGPYVNQHIFKIDPSDLSVVASYDISAQAHEVSSICYCDRDGYFYITDYTSDAVVYKYSTTGSYIGALTVSFSGSELNIQGIEWFNDAFWLVSDANDEVYRMEYGGTVINTGLFGVTVASGNMEGICRKNDRLVVLEDPSTADSYIQEWRPRQIGLGAGGGYDQAPSTTQHIDIKSVAGLTTFTLGVTAIFDALAANRAVMSYHKESDGTTNTRVTIAFSNTNTSLGVWDPNNSWLLPSPGINPSTDTPYRMHATYNGATERKIYVNGEQKNTQSGITAAPSGLSRLLLGREDDSNAEQHDGKIGFAYLRASVLSEDWIAAEYANLNTPGVFYEVADLAGGATVVAAAAGGLTVGVQLVGAAGGVTSAAGVLSTEIQLAVAAAALATASGYLQSGLVELSGGASGAASVTGDLSTEIMLDAAAIAQALVSGGLSTDVRLSAAADAVASALGALTVSVHFNGAAMGQVLSGGALDTEILLGAAAQALAGGYGDLTVYLPLGGSAAAQAVATGALALPDPPAKTFVLGGLSLPFQSHLDLSQDFEEEQSSRVTRHADGSARKQTAWRGKLRTRITGQGWIPPGFDLLDYEESMEMSCIALRAVTSVERVIALPAARRSDQGFQPFAAATVDGGQIDATITGISGDIVTVAVVSRAQFYTVYYYPKIQVFASLPTQRHDAISDTYSWELEAREV
jgi:hypothetical protein